MKIQSENEILKKDSKEWALLNGFQRDFPIVSQPFRVLAEQLKVTEEWILKTLQAFQQKKLVSRIGPVYRPNALGVSTLAALKIESDKIEKVAEYVNSFSEVNHNYERENELNLWFVVTATNEKRLSEILAAISDFAQSPVHDFRLLQEFRIDLGFSLDGSETRHFLPKLAQVSDSLSQDEKKVAFSLQSGIEITEYPFRKIAQKLELSEERVLEISRRLIEKGTIRRFGLVLLHRRLGFHANAMCVWSVPDLEVEKVGQKLAAFPFVTLCYQRKTTSEWPYNLYCMIHGTDKNIVKAQIETLNEEIGKNKYPHNVLFSQRAFKQRGADYRPQKQRSLTEFERKLVDKLQNGIAVVDRPFEALAKELYVTEEEICSVLEKLLKEGLLTRFGPMFNVEKLGGEFSLVAMSVPEERFAEVNDTVNSFAEVAHNYEREHEWNMWFVTAVVPKEKTSLVLDKIEKKTGLKTYSMPKLKEFYLDLRLEVRE